MRQKRTSSSNHFNIINILGLSIGITCVLAIMLWVNDELNYDAFHKNADKIYRVLVEESGMVGYTNSAMSARPLANALNEKLPQVDKAANFEMDWNIVTHVADNYFKEEDLAVVSENFFSIFSFPFIKGSPQLLTQDKYAVVISENMAQKYFGKDEAVGKNFEIEGKNVTVAGVFKEINYNSHIRFNIAITEKLGHDIFHSHQEWDSQNLYTYVSIAPNVTYGESSKAIYRFIPDNINSKYNNKLLLQPLKEIHFQKGLSDEDYTYLGNKTYVYIFSFMGLFILILACINYINLSTAISEKHIKENSVRKILGASKVNIIKSSLVKSLITSFLATGIAVGIIFSILPLLSSFTQKHLQLNISKPFFVLFILVIPVITALLSGIYPALHFASFSPLNLSKKTKSSLVNWHRNGLVVLQFTMSICLIVATLVSYKQLKYQRNYNIGFNKKQSAYFNIDIDKSGYKTLKENLLKIPGVEMVAGKNYFSSSILNTTEVKWTGFEKGIQFSSNSVNEDFFPLLQIDFLAGSNFDKNLESNLSHSIIINKKAQDLIGKDNPVGMNLYTKGKNYTVIGVIDNVHFRSINESVQPEFYCYTSNPGNIFIRFGNNPSVSNSKIIDKVNSTIKESYPDQPFELEFLDATYARLYNNDKRVSTIFSIIAVIAIFISCIGLFGLSSYSIERRIKEIGIRKVSGAKIMEVISMLNQDFVKWVVIAFVSATPIAYYAMNKWLENFAYKTNLNWWIFALAGMLALGIALLTVSWQSWRAATRNPVEALRYE